MKAVVQRVSRAAVTVAGVEVGAIGVGLMVLVGAERGDSEADAVAVADKIAGLRIFSDPAGKMNLAVGEIGGSVLVVSQFTLAADVRKGRRPSFIHALEPERADQLVELVAERVAAAGVPVATGRFGATMDVDLVNTGPVTILLTSRDGKIVGELPE